MIRQNDNAFNGEWISLHAIPKRRSEAIDIFNEQWLSLFSDDSKEVGSAWLVVASVVHKFRNTQEDYHLGKQKCIDGHASLCPSYKGSNP